MNQTLTWPERPTCHDQDPAATRWGPSTWRPAGVRLHPENDHIPAFRSCSYCGSMHPEDLLKAIEAGAKLGGSDWKYGWPHKFYVDGVPNTNAGNLVTRSSGGGPGQLDERKRADLESRLESGSRLEVDQQADRYEYRVLEPDGPTTHGKWYNIHLKDLSAEAFALLAPLLEQHAGIRWERDADGRIKFIAPSPGYQR